MGKKPDDDDEYITIYWDDDDDGDGSDDEMPEGCAACGGPWPSCQSSCSLFDD